MNSFVRFVISAFSFKKKTREIWKIFIYLSYAPFDFSMGSSRKNGNI